MMAFDRVGGNTREMTSRFSSGNRADLRIPSTYRCVFLPDCDSLAMKTSHPVFQQACFEFPTNPLSGGCPASADDIPNKLRNMIPGN
jgi:hypothetical protein